MHRPAPPQAQTTAFTPCSSRKAASSRAYRVMTSSPREHCLNEVNTLPGFTSISMWPKLMMASGMTYPEAFTPCSSRKAASSRAYRVMTSSPREP